MTLRQLPNLISLARLLLAVPVAVLIVREHYLAALLLFVPAALSDGLDGLLAKRYGWSSTFGGVLDAVADKALMGSALLAALYVGLLPFWLVLLVLGRDALIGLGALAYRWLIGPYVPAPLMLSKINTGLLMLLLVTALAEQGLVVLPPVLSPLLSAAVTLSVLLSGSAYVWAWGQRARAARRAARG